PPAAADDVHRLRGEGVGGADHRADVVVVLEVLDGNVERMPTAIQVGHDGFALPVSVLLDHVAPVTVLEELRVVVFLGRPRTLPRPDADLAAGRPLGGSGLVGHASPKSPRPSSERYSNPRASMASRAPVSRSTMVATPTTVAEASSSASTAVRTLPPVVEVSWTASTRCPATSMPSMRRCRPCCLLSLRTTNASSTTPSAAAECSIAVATGSAPRVRPPAAT